MGQTVVVSCRECDYREMSSLGVGMLDSSLEKVLDRIEGKARAEVEEILQHGPIMHAEYGGLLFRCPRCNALYDQFYVRILYGDGLVYETTFCCRRCGGPLRRVDLDGLSAEYPGLADLPCPGCGKPALEAHTMLLWD